MQKATLGGSTEFTIAAGSIVVLIFFSFQVYTRYLLSEKGFRSLCLKEEVLASHCFSSYRTACAHTELLAPPRSRNTSVHHCLSAVLQSHRDPSVQESNQSDADFFLPSWKNGLINSPWRALEFFFFILF